MQKAKKAFNTIIENIHMHDERDVPIVSGVLVAIGMVIIASSFLVSVRKKRS